MKKLFAVVLAVAMAMSMAAVSFADLYVSNTPLDFVADTNYMRDDVTKIQYGDTVYFNIWDDVDFDTDFGGDGIASYKFMEKVKIKTTFEMGEEIVEKVELVKKPASIMGAPEYTEYFIAIKLGKKLGTVETDVVGTFEIDRKEVKIDGKVVSPKVDSLKVDFAFPVFFTNTWINDAENYLVDGDEVELKYDTFYALKFDCDEEVEFVFGDKKSALNEGTFTVDVSGQGKVYLRFNTLPDASVAVANEGVDMRFVNFGGVKFNRAGEFMYEMEDGVAAYQVVDGALVEIPGCEYNAADEAFYFRTNVLGNYVFANAELVNPVK